MQARCSACSMLMFWDSGLYSSVLKKEIVLKLVHMAYNWDRRDRESLDYDSAFILSNI